MAETRASIAGGQVMAWTVERIRQLEELAKTDLSCREIGNRLGVSKNAVISKIRRLDLYPPARGFHWNDERRQRLRDLARDDKNRSEVATILGCGVATVSAEASRLGIRLKKQIWTKWTDEQLRSVLAMRKKRMSYRDIAERFDTSENVVGHLLRRARDLPPEQPKPEPTQPKPVNRDFPKRCRWPKTHCNGTVQPGQPYCAEHLVNRKNSRAKEWNGGDTRAGW